jgi:hypothetical protein
MDGYGEYSFHSDGRKAARFFWGYFYVNGLQERYDVYGEKLSWRQARTYMKSSLKHRGEVVKAFIETCRGSIVQQEWRSGTSVIAPGGIDTSKKEVPPAADAEAKEGPARDSRGSGPTKNQEDARDEGQSD